MISSDDIDTVHILMDQVKQVLGLSRCPVCKEILSTQEEIDFQIDGKIICQICNTELTKLEKDRIHNID